MSSDSSSAATRYPRTTGSALIECPTHGCTVVLGDDGRIKTCCPSCLREAKRASARLHRLYKHGQQ